MTLLWLILILGAALLLISAGLAAGDKGRRSR